MQIVRFESISNSKLPFWHNMTKSINIENYQGVCDRFHYKNTPANSYASCDHHLSWTLESLNQLSSFSKARVMYLSG